MKLASNSSVDVVIPFYQETEQLRSAVISCLLPGNNEYIARILIVCDGSDEIYRWASDNIAPMDSRVSLLKTVGGEGSGPARNFGLSSSLSEFVAFLDADDIWLPNKLSRQLRELESKSNAAGCCTAYVINGASLVVPQDNYRTERDVFRHLKIGTSTVLLRRQCLHGLFFTARRFSQDTEFWVNFVKRGNLFIGIKDCSCIYFPSLRTGNKVVQLLNFDSLICQFKFSLWSRLEILLRYSIRGLMSHLISRIAQRI